MTISKKLYRRIFLLSAILVIVELIYLGVKKEFVSIDASVLTAIELVLTFIVSLLVCTIVLRLTGDKVYTMFEKEMELEQRIIVSKLYAISVYSLAIIITFWKAGVSLGNITIFIGLMASGFAFAVRDLLLSFFAWFIILNKKPFHMGDYIKIDNESGLVTRIGTFFFTLEQARKPEFVKVPNSIVLSKSIRNLGTGSYVHEIQYALKGIPNNLDEISKNIVEFIQHRSQLKNVLKCSISSEQGIVWFRVEYSTNFDQEGLKPSVNQFICTQLDGYLRFGNAVN
jgi:MscS family membrane protein